MIPILTVGNESHKIKAITFKDDSIIYTVIEKDGQKIFHWDASVHMGDDALELDKVIQWHGRYEPLIEAIDKLIEIRNDELIKLSKEITEHLIVRGFVPPAITAKYQELSQKLNGVTETKMLINDIAKIQTNTDDTEGV